MLYNKKMVKKSTLESILKEEMSEMWSVLTNEDKRIITDNFRIHTFKKNEVIYSEREEPKLLMCLLKGKVKIYKDGVGGRSQIIRLIRLFNISDTGLILPMKITLLRHRLSKLLRSELYPCPLLKNN